MNTMNINGLNIDYTDGKLTITGLQNSRQKQDIVIDKSGNIEGDINGNITVKGSNVTLIVKGDVVGNVTGCQRIEVQGDIVGNVQRF